MEFTAWNGFQKGEWSEKIAVSDFIRRNYTPYTGEADFLAGATPRTNALMEKCNALFKAEREKGGADSLVF